MLSDLKPQAKDAILSLMQMYREDPRDNKIDLGVGVYRDADGNTPVMRAVKSAEKRILESQDTKAYTGLAGDPAFSTAITGLLLGDTVSADYISAVATPGGTGALRQVFELIKLVAPEATIWLSDPTWPNHPSIIDYLELKRASYRYFDAATRRVDFAGMMADLANAKPGDVVLLHGCCHNPTGANLTEDQWAEVIALLKERGLTPLVDIAYQGFGDGLAEDARGLHMVAAAMEETLIAASCSKNFGVYRERTGVLIAINKNPDLRALVQANLAYLNRQNFSFPPDHGARVVTEILTDPTLRADWESELEEIRLGMLDLRKQLAAELRRLTNSDRFDFIEEHRGMFSRLGASPEQVEQLRTEHAIYLIGDSRMNIAGLNKDTVPILAKAIVDCGI